MEKFIDCKLYMSVPHFREFQTILFSLGYRWINQHHDDEPVHNAPSYDGIILRNGRIYGAHGTTSQYSSFVQSNVDLKCMREFIRENRIKTEPVLKASIEDKIKAAEDLGENNVVVEESFLQNIVSKFKKKNGEISLPVPFLKALIKSDSESK